MYQILKARKNRYKNIKLSVEFSKLNKYCLTMYQAINIHIRLADDVFNFYWDYEAPPNSPSPCLESRSGEQQNYKPNTHLEFLTINFNSSLFFQKKWRKKFWITCWYHQAYLSWLLITYGFFNAFLNILLTQSLASIPSIDACGFLL